MLRALRRHSGFDHGLRIRGAWAGAEPKARGMRHKTLLDSAARGKSELLMAGFGVSYGVFVVRFWPLREWLDSRRDRRGCAEPCNQRACNHAEVSFRGVRWVMGTVPRQPRLRRFRMRKRRLGDMDGSRWGPHSGYALIALFQVALAA
jgi:hypothetical protein